MNEYRPVPRSGIDLYCRYCGERNRLPDPVFEMADVGGLILVRVLQQRCGCNRCGNGIFQRSPLEGVNVRY